MYNKKVPGDEQSHGNEMLETGLLLMAVGLELTARAAPYEPQEAGPLGRVRNSDHLQVSPQMLEVLTQRLSAMWLEIFDQEIHELDAEKIWKMQRMLDDFIANGVADSDLEPEWV
jgi:hypothetical protein